MKKILVLLLSLGLMFGCSTQNQEKQSDIKDSEKKQDRVAFTSEQVDLFSDKVEWAETKLDLSLLNQFYNNVDGKEFYEINYENKEKDTTYFINIDKISLKPNTVTIMIDNDVPDKIVDAVPIGLLLLMIDGDIDSVSYEVIEKIINTMENGDNINTFNVDEIDVSYYASDSQKTYMIDFTK